MPPDEETTPPEAPEVGHEPSGTAKAPTATPQSVNWEKRFNGLNSAYQKLQDKYTALEEERNTLLASIEESKQGDRLTKAQVEKLQADLLSAQTEKESLSTQITTLQATKQRINLVMAEFPELAQFEAKGLLPNASTEEEMRSKFTDFRLALGGMVQQSVQGKAQGAGPAPSGAGTQAPTLTREQIYAELTRLAGSRKDEDRLRYTELLKAWDNLNK